MKTTINTMVLLLVMTLAVACHEDYSPRPRGYFRIDLPKKSYKKLDTTLPYKFEYPAYATITNDPYAPGEKNWINVNFPSFKAVLHLSYEPVNNNLDKYLNDAHTLVSKHIPKAEAIYDSLIYHPDKNIYGLAFRIEGLGAASPYQFYVTDSVKHYLRGALYFNMHPNNDSLAPVINFLEKDIDHLVNTMEWKRE